MSEKQQPKILQKRLMRTAIAVILLAGLYSAWRYLPEYLNNDNAVADTKGKIIALRTDDKGTRAVLIDAKSGEVKESPDWVEGADDRDVVWRPDGQRAYVVRILPEKPGEKLTPNYQIYRWNTQSGEFQVRTTGTRTLSTPRFFSWDKDDRLATALVIAGGKVLKFDPNQAESTTQVVLPPRSKDDAALSDPEGNGRSSEIDEQYGSFGQSFRDARYLFGREAVVAVLKAEAGEALIFQRLVGTPDERRPKLIAFGEHIDLDVSPVAPVVVYSVTNFRWRDPKDAPPEFIKNGKLTRPYAHCLGLLDVGSGKSGLLDKSDGNERCFAAPRIDPTGQALVCLTGKYNGPGDVQLNEMEVMGLAGGNQKLMQGTFRDVSWHPGGKKLIYAKKTEEGKFALFQLAQDSTGETRLTKDNADYSQPAFSPQGD
jgi:dipeptidyl aminopeptidase/acylaminoacyl peptidase